MIQEIQTNNFELYRHTLTNTGVSLGGSVADFRRYRNYYFTASVSATEVSTLKKYDLDWNLISSVDVDFVSGASRICSYDYDGSCYIYSYAHNLLKRFIYENELFKITGEDASFNLGYRPSQIFKYKNKWFVLNTMTVSGSTYLYKIYRYGEGTDGHFDVSNLELTFDNTNSFNNNLTTTYNINTTIQPKPIINYDTGELLLFTYSSTDFHGTIHILNLENMVTSSTIVAPTSDYFYKQGISSSTGAIPYFAFLNPFIKDGHYCILEKQGPPIVQSLESIYLYDYDFNLINRKKLEIASFRHSYSDGNDILYVNNAVDTVRTIELI